MKKYKDFIKNIGILTLSNLGSKLLAFILVPLYTFVLSTTDYGEYDFIFTTISLLFPILTVCITEGALRFLLDKESNKKHICDISYKYIVFSIIVVLVLSIINYYFNIISIIKEYTILFILFYISFALLTYYQNIARGFDKLKELGISGVINSCILFLLNIIFLLIFKIGIIGYFLSTILSNFITIVYLKLKLKLKELEVSIFSEDEEKELLKYSKPLMFNSIGWWVNSVSDRYVVTYICGAAVNGIYSIAYKIPTILNIFQSIFNQAWTISTAKDMNDENENQYIYNVYNIYNIVICLICSALIILTKPLSSLLFQKDFFEAWYYMPPLLFSAIFGALSGCLGGVFSSKKDSKTLGTTTVIGAVINMVFNIILVLYIGAIGAAISTLISTLIVWILRLYSINKSFDIKLNNSENILTYILLFIQMLLVYSSKKITIFLSFIILILIIFINLEYIKKVIKFLRRKRYGKE